MWRAVVILAVGWFLALGTGAVEFAHNAQHAREDARRTQPDQPSPVHNDSNCSIHAQIHQPVIASPAIVLLISAGLLLAFVSQLAAEPDGVRSPSRIDCRGPPRLV
ncbi:hypothetical protein BH09PLA1_BH09PLA1_06290 [soil metagenome]